MCPSGRQTLLFSATMPAPVARLAEQYMYDPVTIRVTPKKLTVDSVEQAYVMVEPRKKLERLAEVLKAEEPEQAIIFVRTKIGAARLGRDLADKGLRVKALHGDLSQGQRDGVMISFKEHKTPLLVATDIAARGLDIEHVTHVINYDMPNNPEIYVHRIGRTGRVGRTGRAITFATAKQAGELKEIERTVKAPIGEWEPPEERLEHAPTPRHREGPPPVPTNGTVKLFVNRGKRGGISEEDLSWALREGAVLPEDAIHSIRVLDRFSFVEVSADQAERAVEYLDGTKLKGKQIRMEIAKSSARGAARRHPFHRGGELLDLRDQVLPLERLRDAVGGAERAHPIGLLRVEVGRDHHDRHLRSLAPDLLEYLGPRHVRHHRVEQDDVGLLGSELAQALQGLDAVGGGDDVVALHLQPALEHEEHGLGVVRDQ